MARRDDVMARSGSSPARQPADVRIHPSRFPEAVEAALEASLERRQLDHRFLYETPRQALRWLRVHEAFSPARRDASCRRAYSAGVAVAARRLRQAKRVMVIGLGCGGGQKEAELLAALAREPAGRPIAYLPVDVSPSLTLVARAAALGAGLAAERCHPNVLDLASEPDWKGALADHALSRAVRLVTFFGLLPNFTPRSVLPQLASMIGAEDLLLASANLAPGRDYDAAVARVLPQYDNALTHDWLIAGLTGLGFEASDGHLEFRVARCPDGTGLLRIEAGFRFDRPSAVALGERVWRYGAGEWFGLFYSYRHTAGRVRALFAAYGLTTRREWSNAAGDESVFLLERTRQAGHR